MPVSTKRPASIWDILNIWLIIIKVRNIKCWVNCRHFQSRCMLPFLPGFLYASTVWPVMRWAEYCLMTASFHCAARQAAEQLRFLIHGWVNFTAGHRMYQTETGCSWMLRAPFSTVCTTGMTTIQIPTSSPRENACAKLSTRILCCITPWRWMNGGTWKGQTVLNMPMRWLLWDIL